ncbi:hypothetical protein RRG08_021005 [Elysia crispata]|uniref:Secreted protein n=1 Tax=Elysia crispata TaxID=231223 RepID=A0AAE0YSS3_9GAST|nr:hypothetical protein RRG08_021005 [Elysia crispata]
MCSRQLHTLWVSHLVFLEARGPECLPAHGYLARGGKNCPSPPDTSYHVVDTLPRAVRTVPAPRNLISCSGYLARGGKNCPSPLNTSYHVVDTLPGAVRTVPAL